MTTAETQLVAHAVLHCTAGTSDKIWAGVVVQERGRAAQALTYYGRRGGGLKESARGFASTPQALRYFDDKMQEKLERHGYVRCDWRSRDYGVQHDLPVQVPDGAGTALAELRGWRGTTATPARSFASLVRPATPRAYAPGVYAVDQEPAWYYVVPLPVDYGYALNANAMLVERDHVLGGRLQEGARMRPTWVWRAHAGAPAFLEPATDVARDTAAAVVERVALELIAQAYGL